MKYRLVLSLLSLSLLLGCAATKDYLPAFDLGMAGVECAASTGLPAAIADKSMSKGVAWVVSREGAKVLRSYAATVMATGEWLSEIPGFDIGYNELAPLQNPDGTWRPVMPEKARTIVEGVLAAVTVLKPQVDRWINDADIACKAKVWLKASLAYLLGLVGPIVDELAAPDGSVVIPAVPLDFSACME